MSSAQLLTAQQLAARLSEPDLLVLDCRFALEDRPTAPASIRKTTFPARISPISNGIFPLPCAGRDRPPSAAGSRRTAAQTTGLGPAPGQPGCSTTTAPARSPPAPGGCCIGWASATGLPRRRPGGLEGCGLALTNGESSLRPGDFQGQPDASLLIDAATLQAQLGQPGLALLDARAQPLPWRSRAHRSSRRAHSRRPVRRLHRQPRQRRPLPSAGTIAPAFLRPAARSPGGRAGRLLRLRRHRLPQPVRPEPRRLPASAPLRRLVERVDHRPAPPGRHRRLTPYARTRLTPRRAAS